MAIDLEALRIFAKVAELSSFTRAADHLGMPKARVSVRIQALETEVGIRLLHRTTRTVKTTPDGEQFLARAQRLVAEADELGAMFQAPSTLRGRVRIDLPVALAQEVVFPRLPDLFAAHPLLEVQVSATDRRVDVVREGFDCVLRVGTLADSGLTVRRLGSLPMKNYASADYLRRCGTPQTIEDLDGHFLIHYSLALGADPPEFEYPDGDGYAVRSMKCLVTVNSAAAFTAACQAGLGIIQSPRGGKDGLVEVLPHLTCASMPVSLVHPHGRQVPKRVRAVMSFLAQVLAPHVSD